MRICILFPSGRGIVRCRGVGCRGRSQRIRPTDDSLHNLSYNEESVRCHWITMRVITPVVVRLIRTDRAAMGSP